MTTYDAILIASAAFARGALITLAALFALQVGQSPATAATTAQIIIGDPQ
ncbi:hypothetical protein [Phreatobacter aquaticus]|nr:hypothetical protein [Phreatobacter aquaticus]